MRILSIHVDHFRSEVTERGRSRVIEDPEEKVVSVDEALVILSCVERADEISPSSVVRRAVEEIETMARQLKVDTLVIHSFAHLFAELARPSTALSVLKELADQLRRRGFTVHRTPFGWFNTLDLRAKGHPLSRMARVIPPDEPRRGSESTG
ncbi:MAG: hypothetical protein D6723_19325 [Acidobacteria bacterium]|nr:MAG: hypothetical protein D6723_19325 [Acidobacteriota bacterium]